ncbi:hypothetical protein HELRODRAFT_183232 [Helobdella robusta]|uniref:Uncharacterized protein n=1 Tax=Helobdella robusta TaxID=6412 RepID=T1FJC7_HELRO|nr:hypothetical protein HELRODRAFT_183232 [Helobdella robusta]ESO11354.1 hypothetical protein HELRODRAFT_183232 [Helobdella robusta]
MKLSAAEKVVRSCVSRLCFLGYTAAYSGSMHSGFAHVRVNKHATKVSNINNSAQLNGIERNNNINNNINIINNNNNDNSSLTNNNVSHKFVDNDENLKHALKQMDELMEETMLLNSVKRRKVLRLSTSSQASATSFSSSKKCSTSAVTTSSKTSLPASATLPTTAVTLELESGRVEEILSRHEDSLMEMFKELNEEEEDVDYDDEINKKNENGDEGGLRLSTVEESIGEKMDKEKLIYRLRMIINKNDISYRALRGAKQNDDEDDEEEEEGDGDSYNNLKQKPMKNQHGNKRDSTSQEQVAKEFNYMAITNGSNKSINNYNKPISNNNINDNNNNNNNNSNNMNMAAATTNVSFVPRCMSTDNLLSNRMNELLLTSPSSPLSSSSSYFDWLTNQVRQRSQEGHVANKSGNQPMKGQCLRVRSFRRFNEREGLISFIRRRFNK